MFSQNIHIEDNIEERFEDAWNYQPSFGAMVGKYVLLCVVAPEGCNQTVKELAIKVFAVYSSKEEADKVARRLSNECDVFDYFVASTCEWLRLPPQVDMIDDVNYHETTLENIKQRTIDMRTARAKLMQERMSSDRELNKKNKPLLEGEEKK
jgi:hypothetical protein